MEKSDCIFCKIIEGKLESVVIWEDDNFLAILDIMPNTHGMTLVIPKNHHDSYLFDLDDDVYLNLLLASKKVSKILEKGLSVSRVAMVMEGMGVNHAHVKLYPLHGVEKIFKETWAKDKIWFEKYEGYISTQTGYVKNIEELKIVANNIKSQGLCKEKNCKRPHTKDYNGCGHMVCDECYDSLTRYFEEEYD